MRPLRVLLADLSYQGPENAHNLYVPLNVGYVASHTKAKFGADVVVEIFKDAAALLDSGDCDLVGLSFYYWNAELNSAVMQQLRQSWRHQPRIIIGGPCIDSDPAEQQAFLRRHALADAIVPNEGEAGFAAVVERLLSGERFDAAPIDGASFLSHGSYVQGRSVGLSVDLATVPSPWLDGTLDDWTGGPYQPMIQTSRLCPYTCSFCVSGKNRGKLRAFPIEQVREEIEFIAPRFRDRPDAIMYVTDENFGIMERDRKIAEIIVGTRGKHSYPQRVFYYNDKRFTQTSRDLQEVLGDICHHGVMLSLQSENPETLKAIRRRNLTDEQIVSALAWARGLGLKTSTELIFGLPMETLASFLTLLDKCARFGFEAIQCYNLIIFDGIEMNRHAYRSEHGLTTRRRLLHGSSSRVAGHMVAESEEVVVSSKSFSEEDYRLVRKLNVMFHAIFVEGLHRQFFRKMVERGDSLTGFLREFLTPCPSQSAEHREFIAQLDQAIEHELYSCDEVRELVRRADVGEAALPEEVKVQPIFARRLKDAEDGWVTEALAPESVAA